MIILHQRVKTYIQKVQKLSPELLERDNQKYFTWEPHLESVVYDKWCKRAAQRYKDVIHKIKVNSARKRPDFIPASVWPAWIQYWNTDEFKEKSHKAKKNRLSEPDGPGTGISKHKGGSRCAEEHLIAMAKHKGVSHDGVSTWDIFLRLHSGRDGEYTEGKSKRIAGEVRARVEEMSQNQSLDSVEPDANEMSSIYLDVLGRTEKRRVFGLGNRSHLYTASSVDSQSTSQVNTNVISNFEDRLQSFETELRECREKLQREREDGRQEGRREAELRLELLLERQQIQRQEQQMQEMQQQQQQQMAMIESLLSGQMSGQSLPRRTLPPS